MENNYTAPANPAKLRALFNSDAEAGSPKSSKDDNLVYKRPKQGGREHKLGATPERAVQTLLTSLLEHPSASVHRSRERPGNQGRVLHERFCLPVVSGAWFGCVRWSPCGLPGTSVRFRLGFVKLTRFGRLTYTTQ
jgi:hypothetical protein